MPENTPWWKAANPGEKPWETARRAKEAKAAPQDTRGVLRRAWDALNRPVIPVERGVRALMPEKKMGPVGENAAGVGIGLGRVAESLSSPAALGSLGTIGLLSRPGVMGDMLMAFLSGDMGWEAIKNFRKTQDADYQGVLPREKTADYTATTAHGALAVAPWLHMGAKSARSGRPAAPSTKPIPEEFQVNVDPEVRAQVEPNVAQPNLPAVPPMVQPAARPRPVAAPPARTAPEAAPTPPREPWFEAQRREAAQAREASQGAESAKLAAPLEELRQLHEDPLVGDDAVRRYREATKGMDEAPPPDTPWREFEDALGAEIIPKATKPPKFRDMRIDSGDHPLKSVIDAILERGGISIKQAKRAGTLEDWRGSLSPAMYRRIMRQKGGFAPDDIAMMLEGHGVRDENHLRDMLSQYRKQEPIRITKDEQMRKYEEAQAEWDRRMRDEVPPEWLEAMEIDSAKQGAPSFEAGKMPVDREGFLDYELMGVREPGQEGFARFRDDRGSEMPIGAGASRLTMDKDSYPAAGFAPNKTVTAYKLFRVNPKKPGELFPLFVDANTPVPTGEWVRAKPGEQTSSGRVKSKLGELAYRPGWHSGEYPAATHIGGKSSPGLKAPDYRPKDQVWAEVEIPADVDWQSVADSRAKISKKGKPIPRTAHITDQVPFGGHYRYKTNPNMQGSWLISGDMKVKRVLSDQEVIDLNSKAGFRDLPRLRNGEEGFADLSPNKRSGAYPGEFTLVKVEYDTPGAGISSFYDVVEGFTGKRAIAEARKLHPEATKIELDIDDAPTSAFGRDAVREHTDAYYDKLGDMGLDPYWRNQQGFADMKPKDGKPAPVGLFADELMGVQNRQRQEAAQDLFQRILQAEPSNVSKRELLGLDKGKKKKSGGSSPLLDLIKPQGSMFEE